MRVRRINFYAGAGAGKSTVAAKTFAELKKLGYDVEHVPEYIKTWAHEERFPKSYDQLYVFGKQVHAEDVMLRNVKAIVSDSPLLLNTAYSTLYEFKAAPELVRIAQQFDRDFPALNFFIKRTVPYVNKGRYQSEEKSREFDEFLVDFLYEHLHGDLHFVTVDQFKSIILPLIEDKLGGKKRSWLGVLLGQKRGPIGSTSTQRPPPY